MPEFPQHLGFRLLHIGVAVPSLNAATESMASLFGYQLVSGPFDDPIQKVRVNFLSTSSADATQLELIEPLGDDSPIRSMLKKGSGGAYHLCFETSDIEAAVEHAQANGCVIVSTPKPAVAFQGRRIAWIYTATRQLFELVEATQPSTETY